MHQRYYTHKRSSGHFGNSSFQPRSYYANQDQYIDRSIFRAFQEQDSEDNIMKTEDNNGRS